MAIRLEAIATRNKKLLVAWTLLGEAIASRLDAIAIRSKKLLVAWVCTRCQIRG